MSFLQQTGELMQKNAERNIALRKLSPIQKQFDDLQAHVLALTAEVKALEDEVYDLEAREAADLRVSNGGIITYKGVGEAMFHSLNYLVTTQSEVLALKSEQRYLLAGTIALTAERAQRKALAGKKHHPAMNESFQQPNALYKAWAPRSMAASLGYSGIQIRQLEVSGELTEACKGGNKVPPAGRPLGSRDLGVPDYAQKMFINSIEGPVF